MRAITVAPDTHALVFHVLRGLALSEVMLATLPFEPRSPKAGFAAGLWRYLRKPDWPAEPERVPMKKATLRAI